MTYLHMGTIKINEIKDMAMTFKSKKCYGQLIISHIKKSILNTEVTFLFNVLTI